jgi:hypothetical protein
MPLLPLAAQAGSSVRLAGAGYLAPPPAPWVVSLVSMRLYNRFQQRPASANSSAVLAGSFSLTGNTFKPVNDAGKHVCRLYWR